MVALCTRSATLMAVSIHPSTSASGNVGLLDSLFDDDLKRHLDSHVAINQCLQERLQVGHSSYPVSML
jgi:hypothetical protein